MTDIKITGYAVENILSGQSIEFNPTTGQVKLSSSQSKQPFEGVWQPIETAPRDGTLILININGERLPISYQMTTFWNINNKWDGLPAGVLPSHWMSLPSPPQALTQGDWDE